MLGRNVRLTQVQVLSHQCKISQKIEVFIGTGDDYHSAHFKRLGHMVLDNNERTNYNARELKTVHVDISGQFIRFLIHRNYVNKFNINSQVGIIAANFAGVEEDTDTNASHSSAVTRGSKMSMNSPDGSLADLSIDMNLDPQTVSRLRALAAAKVAAVDAEDYATAKNIKLVEHELKTLGSQLASLDVAKREAVKVEDYDRATEIKRESDTLRREIERKVTQA